MSFIAKTICVDFIDVLGPGGPSCKLATLRYNLQTTDGCAVAWGTGKLRTDRFAGETRGVEQIQAPVLRVSLSGVLTPVIDARIEGPPKLSYQI
jgi:hypothetical protein